MLDENVLIIGANGSIGCAIVDSLYKAYHVIATYHNNCDTLEKYNALKKRKADYIAANGYDKQAKREIATGFGKLLDYSDVVIDQLIEKNGT